MYKQGKTNVEKILKHLALEGEKSRRDIATHLSVSDRQSDRLIKPLKREKLVRVREQIDRREPGNHIKFFNLTAKGLCAALAVSNLTDQPWKEIEKVIRKHGKLIPLLLKYDVIKAAGLKEDFKFRLRRAAKKTVTDFGYQPPKKDVTELSEQEIRDLNKALSLGAFWAMGNLPVESVFVSDLLKDVCLQQDVETKFQNGYVSFGSSFYKGEDRRSRWVQVLREDDYLRQFTKSVVKRNLEDLKRELKVQEVRLSFLGSLEEAEE